MLDVQKRYMLNALSALKAEYGKRLSLLAARLDALSPLSSLARGYSIAKSLKDNTLVKSVHSVAVGDMLEVRLVDGSLDCTVEAIRGDKKHE